MNSVSVSPARATFRYFYDLGAYNHPKPTQIHPDSPKPTQSPKKILRLTFHPTQAIIIQMTTKLTKLSPEGADVANAYIQYGCSVKQVAYELDVPEFEVVKIIQKPEIKRYLDGIYLDMGYRNRDKIGQAFDKIIEAKLAEAEESGIYSSKDLAELLMMQHKMRMDEIKATKEAGGTTVQVANFGGTGYTSVMEKLMGNKNGN